MKITALDWLNNNIKSDDLYETEMNLGLNKRAKQKHNNVNTVDTVSQIQFEDPETESICHEHGVYTIEDAANVTSLMVTDTSSWFECSKIKSFNEFKYFTGLKEVENGAIWNCMQLQSIELPNNVTKIGDSAFCNCVKLQAINIPDSVEHIEPTAFLYCDSLKNFYISNGHPLKGKLQKMFGSKCSFIGPNEVNESNLGLNKKAKAYM